MKNNLIKLILIELFIFAFSIFSLVTTFLNYYLFLGALLVILVLLYLILKIDKRAHRFNNDFILIIIIGILLYYIISYLLGFFVGFVYSTYSRKWIGIFRNVFRGILYIVLIENIRQRIVESGKYYKTVLIFSVIIFTLLDLVNIFNMSILSSNRLIVQFFLSVFLPLFFKNILLTYLIYVSNKRVTIIYQILYLIPTYILGVFPDLGDYINSTFQTILPIIILFFVLKTKDTKREKVTSGRELVRKKRLSYLVIGFCLVFTAILIYLVSGFGRFYLMAIGSGSMTGTIDKGDTVIIDKKSKVHKKGQVIAFKMEDKVIVHRIISIQITDKGTFYKTKGDYNKSEDGWLLPEENIVGNCILKIPLIGWPSVVLSEFLSR